MRQEVVKFVGKKLRIIVVRKKGVLRWDMSATFRGARGRRASRPMLGSRGVTLIGVGHHFWLRRALRDALGGNRNHAKNRRDQRKLRNGTGTARWVLAHMFSGCDARAWLADSGRL